MLERAPHILAAGHRDGCARNDRRNHSSLYRLAIDFLANEFGQNERTLRVADQHEGTAVVVVLQIVAPGIPHVVILQAVIERDAAA